MRGPTIRSGRAAALALTLICACRGDADAAHGAEARASAHGIDALVSYAGCKQVWLESRPRCLFVPNTTLRLWIDQLGSPELSVGIDGQVWPTKEYVVDGMVGFGLELTLPREAEALVLELPRADGIWSLPLRTWAKGMDAPPGISTSRDVDKALIRVYGLAMQGRHAEAQWQLEEIADLAAEYPKGRADHATYRGVVEWRQGRYHDAATSLAAGVTFAMRLHDRGLIVDAIHVYAGVLAELGYWDAAIDWSEQVLTLAQDEPGLVGCVSGARIMSTVGYAHLLRARYQGESTSRARELLQQALARVGPDGECPEPSSVPGVVLSLADEALVRDEPEVALDLLSTIDIDAAPTADERLRLRDVELRALDVAGHPSEELERALADLGRSVDEAGLPEGDWRLALRRGDVFVREGRLNDAVGEYRNAEALALQIGQLAAVGVGRDSAIALHGQSTERLVGVLAKLGRMDDALCAAREAQARRTQGVEHDRLTMDQRAVIEGAIERYQEAVLELDEARMGEHLLPRREQEALRVEIARSEDALAKLANEILSGRSTWRPSCDDLVERGEGELLLGLYPASEGWFLFVQDGRGTSMRWLETGPSHALDDPMLGVELLEPWSERIAAATRIRVLASDRAQDVDVHLLSWRGMTLIEHVPVTYGAELPAVHSAPVGAAEPVALLVADPTESLPLAQVEVVSAMDVMKTRGWTLDVPAPDETDRARILEALPRASFFYFAGHGVHEPEDLPQHRLPPYAGGGRGWPAHLVLKADTQVTIPDILMLSSAPAHVALLGCETGVFGSSGGGMSLALAFLVAGSEQVVATPVRVGDDTARNVGEGLLSSMSDIHIDLATSLRLAQIAMLRRGQPLGRYRVWVR